MDKKESFKTLLEDFNNFNNGRVTLSSRNINQSKKIFKRIRYDKSLKIDVLFSISILRRAYLSSRCRFKRKDIAYILAEWIKHRRYMNKEEVEKNFFRTFLRFVD